MKKINHFLGYSLALMGFLSLMSCARNPVTGKKQLSLMSESAEKSMGKESDPQIIASMGKYENQDLQDFINAKGQEMARISHRPNLGYEFKIVNSSVVNAFAVPGGYVYFTRGIMAHFNNEAEFAGVLGHEIGHITARHGAQQQTKQILMQVGLIASIIAKPEFIQFAEQAQQGMGLLMLKFGRDDESQSDQLGVQYSTKIGYDSHKMADFFKTLGRITDKEGARIPAFLSTHPDPTDRYNNVHKLSDEAQKTLDKSTLQENRDSYLRRIEGLVYGDDPREGYVENNVFYHPELKFQFPVPASWKTQNTPQQFAMVEPSEKAMMVMTLAQGNSPEDAANTITKQLNLNVLRTENKTINGLPAFVVAGEVMPQQPAQQGSTQQGMSNSSSSSAAQQTPKTAVLSYYIQYNNMIYVIHSVAQDVNFPTYLSTFRSTSEGFKILTDPSKINVTPDKIHIKTAPKEATFGELMNLWNVPQKRQEETAILNSMYLTTPIEKGTLIKVIGK
jgi:predicted Zn-dependent protease